MAKRKAPRASDYNVTKSGAKHKRRKHPILTEEERLQRAARAIHQDRKRKQQQRKRRAAGRSTPAERAFKTTHLDEKGKFKKGNPGKPKGTKGIAPRSGVTKASVKDIIEDVVRNNRASVRDAILRGIRSGPRHSDRYLKIAAEYLDGKPVDTININSQYKQDELESAKRSLGQQLNRLFKTILANRQSPPDQVEMVTPPAKSDVES